MGIATKIVDGRQWMIARNECRRKSVHVMVVNQADWARRVHEDHWGRFVKPWNCENLGGGDLMCISHLRPYEMQGVVFAPGDRGAYIHFSDKYK